MQWTNLTRGEIAAALGQEGFEVSTTTVDGLLDEFGYGLRKPRKVKTMGECADRDAQFKKISTLKARYLNAGLPVVSLDTKKREILGDYVRPGRLLSTAPLRGWDHDFPQHRLGIVIPHGIMIWAGMKGTCISAPATTRPISSSIACSIGGTITAFANIVVLEKCWHFSTAEAAAGAMRFASRTNSSVLPI